MNKYKKISISSILIVVLTFNFVLATTQQPQEINNAIIRVDFAKKWSEFTKKFKKTIEDFATERENTLKAIKKTSEEDEKANKKRREEERKEAARKAAEKAAEEKRKAAEEAARKAAEQAQQQNQQQQNPQKQQPEQQKQQQPSGSPQPNNNSQGSGNPLDRGLGNPQSKNNSDSELKDPNKSSIYDPKGTTFADNNKNPLSISSFPQYKEDAKPYSKECEMPLGPIAYNIGGNNGGGVKCDARTVFVGSNQTITGLPSGVFGGGYINPLKEDKTKYDSYEEDSEGSDYISQQVLYWKGEATKRGQKCIPVNVDYCDIVTPTEYKNILKKIDSMNTVGPTVKVMIKNPLNCGNGIFFEHPVTIGAFQEETKETTVDNVKKLAQIRKLNQIILFAGNNKDKKLENIEKLKLKNTAFSYSPENQYKTVSKCTYNK